VQVLQSRLQTAEEREKYATLSAVQARMEEM